MISSIGANIKLYLAMIVMKLLQILLLFFSLLAVICQASIVGWLLGRDNSPFNILSSDDNFDKLLAKTEQAEGSSKATPEDNSVLAKSDIPFELSLADEKFIADAQKYTDLSLSELDLCQHKVIHILIGFLYIWFINCGSILSAVDFAAEAGLQ